jgi:hypothetical protein
MEEWRNGGMEEWRIGGMEDWRIGGLEEWCPLPCLSGILTSGTVGLVCYVRHFVTVSN